MSKTELMIRSLKRVITTLPFLIVAIISVPVIGLAWTEATKLIGLRTIPVPVVGTGSMYPSLFWSKDEGGPEDESQKVVEEYRTTPHLYRRFNGITLAGRTFLRRNLGMGDLVAFKNEQTSAILKTENKDVTAGFIKRIVGLPGDTLELRDGFVYKNGSLLSEPYIATPRSTYGGVGLADCEKITIPAGQYFVLGDNRKVSSDSRFELGLVKEEDIEYVLPYAEQKLYQSLWRDTSKDAGLVGQPTLLPADFLTLINQVRNNKGLPKLTLKSGLNKSAELRGERLLADENTKYDMQQAISSAGYSNIVLGEFVSHGHFSGQELLENLLYHADSAKQILNKDFTDLGVRAVTREVDGCPTQIIVGHLGGYIPASYDEQTVAGWRSLRDNLDSIIPSWEKAKEYEEIDQNKLKELLTVLYRRRDLAQDILTTMEKKAWLTSDQEVRIKQDEADAKHAEALAKELNKE